MKTLVLFNPLANNRKGAESAEKLTPREGEELVFTDLCEIEDLKAFFEEHKNDERIIIAGGDGTLNRFINALDGECPTVPLYYFPSGSGNDFARDIPKEEWEENGLIPLSAYIKDLPTVTVKGKTYRFLNGIGYGIDGYCCEVGDKQRESSDKPVNYAGIAIKGLLFHFKPLLATVTVDGKPHVYNRVWLAPTMNGRYYGGGMMIAPAQDRKDPEKKVSAVVMYGSGKIKTLAVFPSIFKGEHVKHTEMVEILTGHEITVTFHSPTALQIDGETITDVTTYTVKSAVPCAKQNAEEAAMVN